MVSALPGRADCVFIPEIPPDNNWKVLYASEIGRGYDSHLQLYLQMVVDV